MIDFRSFLRESEECSSDLGMIEIMVDHNDEGFVAYIEGSKGEFEYSQTLEEAVGKLVIEMSEEGKIPLRIKPFEGENDDQG